MLVGALAVSRFGVLALTAATFVAASSNDAFAGGAEDRGLALAEAVHDAHRGYGGELAELRLTVIDPLGAQTTHRLVRRAQEGLGRAERSIIEVVEPGPHAGTRVLTFSDDEVRVHGRDDRTAASLPFHSHLVDHLAGADRARRWVLEKTSGGARAVRLRRETFLFDLIHARLGLILE